MPAVRDDLIRRIWRGVDPYAGCTTENVDLQGWNSQHEWLTSTIEEELPTVIVEVGVWKGTSVIAMARKLVEDGIDGAVIAIDTWLGGYEFWINSFFEDLKFVRGYPTQYQTFMSNVLSQGLQDYIVPLPMDSVSASRLLEHHRITPDIIHIDGCHEYGSVKRDIEHYWPLLAPGGVLIGDDYHADGPWPGVRAAYNELAIDATASPDRPILSFEQGGGKCRIKKSGVR